MKLFKLAKCRPKFMKLFDRTDFVFTHVNLQLVFKMVGFFDKIKKFQGKL